jgi:hypothetical protein
LRLWLLLLPLLCSQHMLLLGICKASLVSPAAALATLLLPSSAATGLLLLLLQRKHVRLRKDALQWNSDTGLSLLDQQRLGAVVTPT